MSGWNWLEKTSYQWGFVIRVLVKATLFFILCNALYAVLQPLPFIGKLSVYGWLVPYRERLPYGENPDSYNLSTHNLETLFATHALNAPKASDEYRVLFMGDSATWGILLHNNETTSGFVNALNVVLADGRKVKAYNVGHPIMSVTKDLMLLDYAKQFNPDMVVWLNTLESLPRSQQLVPPIVLNNAPRVRNLIATYTLNLDASDTHLVNPSAFDQTIVGQRRPLADWLRLQFYGFAWATTQIDQVYGDFKPRTNDFEASDFDGNLLKWTDYEKPQDFTDQDLSFDVIQAAHAMLDVPILLVNEPIFVADGTNSDQRLNFWYPKWAYDSYLDLYHQEATAHNWHYLNLWDAIQPSEFTDSPVHLTPQGSRQLAAFVANEIVRLANP